MLGPSMVLKWVREATWADNICTSVIKYLSRGSAQQLSSLADGPLLPVQGPMGLQNK